MLSGEAEHEVKEQDHPAGEGRGERWGGGGGG